MKRAESEFIFALSNPGSEKALKLETEAMGLGWRSGYQRRGFITFKVEPPAFHLHTWFPGEGVGTVVTHQVPIGTFDGPHPFFGPDGKLL